MEGKLNYKMQGFDVGGSESGDPANGTTDTATDYVNLARDLSAINRKGFEHTTRKGVPLVYHCKMTVYRSFTTDRANSSLAVIPSFAQSNWITRNGAVETSRSSRSDV